MKGAIHYLQLSGDVPPRKKRLFHSIISQETTKLVQTVEGLLDFLRVEENSKVIEKGILFLPDVLRDAAESRTLKSFLASRGVSVTIECGQGVSTIVGDKLRVRTHFDEDEKNTEKHNVLLVKIGGQHGASSRGIHWHVDRSLSIRYLSDEKREKIYDVELTDKDGKKTVFKGADAAPASAIWRTMDCVDCHNRPTHIYRQPQNEIDVAMEQGTIDKTLPYIKREGLRAVKVEYPSHEAARAGIAKDIADFYAKNYPDVAKQQAAAVAQAGKALGDIYSWNVFPAMKVTWGTYPNHIGHKESTGCFRCHDKKHKADDGEKIKKNCDTCHALLAEDETDPAILKQIAGEEPEQAPPPADAPKGDAAATTTQVKPVESSRKGG
jgi:hypothetical protein